MKNGLDSFELNRVIRMKTQINKTHYSFTTYFIKKRPGDNFPDKKSITPGFYTQLEEENDFFIYRPTKMPTFLPTVIFFLFIVRSIS